MCLLTSGRSKTIADFHTKSQILSYISQCTRFSRTVAEVRASLRRTHSIFKNATFRNFHVTFMPFNPASAHFHHAFIYVFVNQNYKVNDSRPSCKSETLPLFASNTATPEVKSTKYKIVQQHTCSALHGHIRAALSSELVS